MTPRNLFTVSPPVSGFRSIIAVLAALSALLLSGCATQGPLSNGGGPLHSGFDAAKAPRFCIFSEADRAALRRKPDYSVVAGNAAKRFNSSGDLSVYLRAVDGVNIRDWFQMQMQFVPAGAHRVVVDVEGTGLFPGEFLPPEIEVMLLPQHSYHVTAKKTKNQDLVQFWDETEGTEKRTLVKEWQGELPNIRWTAQGGHYPISIPFPLIP